MAKRARKQAITTTDAPGRESTPESAADHRLGDFAHDLGRFLGSTQAKATAWLDQRKALLENLVKVRDTAAHYIEQLGGVAARSRRGRPRGANAEGPATARPARTGARKKRTMSADARAKIAAAQRARWAKHRKSKE